MWDSSLSIKLFARYCCLNRGESLSYQDALSVFLAYSFTEFFPIELELVIRNFQQFVKAQFHCDSIWIIGRHDSGGQAWHCVGIRYFVAVVYRDGYPHIFIVSQLLTDFQRQGDLVSRRRAKSPGTWSRRCIWRRSARRDLFVNLRLSWSLWDISTICTGNYRWSARKSFSRSCISKKLESGRQKDMRNDNLGTRINRALQPLIILKKLHYYIIKI